MERMLIIIMALVLMFLVPMIYFSLQQDLTIRAYVDKKTREFVDLVAVFGYITPEMYLKYEKQLKETGRQYEVTMTHSHCMVTPVYLNPQDQDSFQGTYITTYDEIGHETIWNTLFATVGENKPYEMDMEDFFEIQVVGVSKSWGDYLVSMLIPVSYDERDDVWYRKPIRDMASIRT